MDIITENSKKEIDMKELQLFTIMPLDINHVEEICEDIRGQYESGVANYALFSMTLVPEGTPPVDKAGQLCAKYDIFKKRLDEMGLRSGILVQATIGHGYPLSADSPFAKYVGLVDANKTTVCCPYDDAFCDHMRDVFTTLASYKPDVIMVDDDFRLMGRQGKGCACSLHMNAFNNLAGTKLTKEELRELMEQEGDGTHVQYFIETQKDSLLKAARAMREGIDRVNPSLPGLFCGVHNHLEFAEEIAEILAGEGNPIVVRINNGNYTPAGARNLSKVSYRAAVQIEHIRDKADVILAETDTCPQNRYSTGAQSLHAHFTASILEGTKGAKHWITRLAAHEPRSGQAYRKILAKNRGFYDKLAQLEPKLTWLGCRMPLTVRRSLYFQNNDWSIWDGTDGWSTNVLERLGLPLYFSSKKGGAVFLSDVADRKFTDEEILEFFRGPVFLASDTAKRLIDRGFLEYIGVDVREWTGKKASEEELFVNHTRCKAQVGLQELVPVGEDVRADSMVCHSVDKTNYEELFPGTTVFHNKLGGTTVVFCGTPITIFNYIEAFSFLNESRKLQLVRLLQECGQLPVYYDSDEEVYLRAARMEDGKLFSCVFNIGLDPIDEIVLVVEQEVNKVERIASDGKIVECSFRKENGQLVVETPAYTLNPVALIIS